MTTKKKVIKKKVVAEKVKVELVSYAIKMVIPTDDYANIQPEIIVKASHVEDAHNYIAPHMNKLWKDYYLVNKRRPEPVPVPVPATAVPPLPVEATGTLSNTSNTVSTAPLPANTSPPASPPPPDSSVALAKATSAIESCLGVDALNLIRNQIDKSVKLTEEDKKVLKPLIETKEQELVAKEFDK